MISTYTFFPGFDQLSFFGSLYLLGGWDPQTQGTGGIILDTVHKLDMEETGEWTALPTALPNGPTSRHITLKFQESKAFLHNHRCSDHVWILDAETDSFTKQPTKGTAPSSRGLHCATMASDNVAVIFGGAAKDGVMSNEAFLLDTSTWKWTPIETDDGPCPTPRAGASLCCYNNFCVILFGGAETSEMGLNPRGDVWALHFDAESGKGQWELLLPDDDSKTGPEPRNAATLSPIQPLNGRGTCFLLTGGWAPFRQTWNDCFVLRVYEKKT
jgi:Galactose oxidase, central domain